MGRPRKVNVAEQVTEVGQEVSDRPSTVNRSNRPKRVPLNGYRNILGVTGQEPGYHYCWVNDYNVDRHLNGGYDYVTHDVQVGDKRIDAASIEGGHIKKPVGNGVVAYLMRCPDEVFQEEMQIIQESVDESEQTMKAHKNQEGRYGDVKIGNAKEVGIGTYK